MRGDDKMSTSTNISIRMDTETKAKAEALEVVNKFLES